MIMWATYAQAKIARSTLEIANGVLNGICGWWSRVDVRQPGKGSSNSHGARSLHLIITMVNCILTSKLSIQNSLSLSGQCVVIF